VVDRVKEKRPEKRAGWPLGAHLAVHDELSRPVPVRLIHRRNLLVQLVPGVLEILQQPRRLHFRRRAEDQLSVFDEMGEGA
jgi:hypothetical protein